MTLVRRFLVLSCAVALSACATNRHCSGVQKYENAVSIPVLVGTDDLRVPSAAAALKVPEAKGEFLTFGYLTPDPAKAGRSVVQCLDTPPPIPPQADAGK